MGLSFPELPPSFLICLFLYSAEALESFCSVFRQSIPRASSFSKVAVATASNLQNTLPPAIKLGDNSGNMTIYSSFHLAKLFSCESGGAHRYVNANSAAPRTFPTTAEADVKSISTSGLVSVSAFLVLPASEKHGHPMRSSSCVQDVASEFCHKHHVHRIFISPL